MYIFDIHADMSGFMSIGRSRQHDMVFFQDVQKGIAHPHIRMSVSVMAADVIFGDDMMGNECFR